MGGNPKAEHKSVLPSNPSHPGHQNWLQKQQTQGQGTYPQVPAMAAAAMHPNQWQMQQPAQAPQQQYNAPMQQGFMAPGGMIQAGGMQPPMNQGMQMQNYMQQMPPNFNQGAFAGGMTGTNLFGPVL